MDGWNQHLASAEVVGPEAVAQLGVSGSALLFNYIVKRRKRLMTHGI